MRKLRRVSIGFGILLLAVALTIPATVAGQAGQPAPTGFVPADQLDTQEALPATPLVFVAYAFVWLLLLGYLLVIARRLGRVERELRAVAERLRASGKG